MTPFLVFLLSYWFVLYVGVHHSPLLSLLEGGQGGNHTDLVGTVGLVFR